MAMTRYQRCLPQMLCHEFTVSSRGWVCSWQNVAELTLLHTRQRLCEPWLRVLPSFVQLLLRAVAFAHLPFAGLANDAWVAEMVS